MSEFNLKPAEDEAPDAVARFMLALAASLVLHLALILGVQVKAVQRAEGPLPVMEVRVEREAEAASRAKLSAELPKEAEKRPVAAEAVHRETAAVSQPDKPASPAVEPLASPLPALEIPLLEDPTWYPAKQVDVHPTALNLIKPSYPYKAAAQGVEGHVVLLLLIDEAGVVKEAAVAEANPEGVFEESALAAFREARFAPAQKNGRAVKSRVLIRVTYELNDRERPITVQPPLPAP